MERRINERFELEKLATCRMPATPVAIMITDLSQSGCACTSESNLPRTGVTIILQLAESEISGQVVWHRWGRFGVHFHNLLTQADLDRLLGIVEPQKPVKSLLTDGFGRPVPRLPIPARYRPV